VKGPRSQTIPTLLPAFVHRSAWNDVVLRSRSSLRASGYFVTRCNNQITKHLELRFRALLTEDTSEVEVGLV
jgi:demethoxyubiquinone hydroxylase (CLK1/Coq7/Cat5 family)